MSAVPIRARVHAVEGENVHIVLEDGQSLRVPQSSCEGAPKNGVDVRIVIAVPGSEDAGRQAIARELLNELLTPNTRPPESHA